MIAYDISILAMMGLALLKGGSRPFAVVLILTTMWTWFLEGRGHHDLMVYADGSAAYAMIYLLVFWRFSWWGVIVAALSLITVSFHLAYWWTWSNSVDYTGLYVPVLNGLFFSSVLLTLLGGYDAFSRVASLLARFRRFRLHVARMGRAGGRDISSVQKG